MYNTHHTHKTYIYISKQAKYLHNSNVRTCEYIPILAIHTKNNTFQYICQYIPIYSTIQTTKHTNTYHKVRYLPIHTHIFTDGPHLCEMQHKIVSCKHLHILSPYFLHSMIAACCSDSYHAFWQYQLMLGMLLYILSRLGSIAEA